MSSRYAGKPFLRLIECYVLESIGELSEKDRANLIRMESRLQELYDSKGSWYEIVGDEMAFPDSLPKKLSELWSQYLSGAEVDISVDPNEFAMSFVDSNFPNIVSS